MTTLSWWGLSALFVTVFALGMLWGAKLTADTLREHGWEPPDFLLTFGRRGRGRLRVGDGPWLPYDASAEDIARAFVESARRQREGGDGPPADLPPDSTRLPVRQWDGTAWRDVGHTTIVDWPHLGERRRP